MTEQELLTLNEKIEKLDEEAMEAARARQEKLAKPPGSLGVLEEISIQMAGITGQVKNTIEKTCVLVMCADNGVVEEKVASTPQSVTLAQTINFTRRLTGIGALAESFGSELLIVDVGINGTVPENLYTEVPFANTRSIVNRSIARGTKNLAKEAAMTRAQALEAIQIGIEMAWAIDAADIDLMGIGEMGIGNTTTSAALLCALTSHTAEETVGRGGGLDDTHLCRKKEIVQAAADRCEGKDVLGILAEVGGFDIAAMAGAFIGAALHKIPVVIDGYISVVAALVASHLAPACKQYMFASHQSCEQGYRLAIKELGLSPFLQLQMRLGEGTGCPLAFKIIEGACGVMNRMATFEEAQIDDGYLEELRKGNCF